jgi:hypothetical protein
MQFVSRAMLATIGTEHSFHFAELADTSEWPPRGMLGTWRDVCVLCQKCGAKTEKDHAIYPASNRFNFALLSDSAGLTATPSDQRLNR